MGAKPVISFHVVTLFPEAFDSYFASSIIGRAIREKKIRVKFYNPRDFAERPKGKKKEDWFYKQVDGKPFGGGPGMVLMAEPFLKAAKKALGKRDAAKYFFDASGKQFTNVEARALAKKGNDILLICGRYEGIDARVQKALKAKKTSVGPYTLTGGELPAMLMIDAISRQIPGVLGKFESVEEERIASSEVYTRPDVLSWGGKRYPVPGVLRSGDHKKIEEWRKKRDID